MGAAFDGQVVALVGRGIDFDRAFAVACAEQGAAVALGTAARSQEQDYALNSVANEVWSIGREHFVRAMDSGAATAVTAFADEVWDRLGRCDVLLVNTCRATQAPLAELSADEWEDTLRTNLTAPFLVMQAFGRLMERQGSGAMVAVCPSATDADAATRAAHGGLEAAVAILEQEWAPRGVHSYLLDAQPLDDPAKGVEAVLALLAHREPA